MTVVGCSGHQALSPSTRDLVVAAFTQEFDRIPAPLTGVSSLAAGADQLFAQAVLVCGGFLHVVVPSAGYDKTFTAEADRRTFEALLGRASETTVLPYPEPTEEAFLEAGRVVVDRSDVLMAVWDGQPSGGLGGTADIVAYARKTGRPVRVIWPPGSTRG